MINIFLKQVNDIKSMWEELINDDSIQRYRGAVQINCDTTSNKYMDTGDRDRDRDDSIR